MRVLVTGAAGFIGSRLAAALRDRGQDVVGLDNFLTGRKEQIPGGIEFLEGDIRNPGDCAKACNGAEVVFHQAARRSVARSVDDPALTDQCNTFGTLTLLLAARDAGVRRLVYASSSSVYGDLPEPIRTETQTPHPISPYAVSKLAGEHYCRVIEGIETVSLRYFNVFGPGQPRESKYSLVFPAFIDALRTGTPPEIDWDGEQSRDFTFIDDVVAANLAAANASGVDGEVFNVGGGNPKTINQVLRDVADAVGVWIDPVRTPKRPADVRATHADITKAHRLLDWRPEAVWHDAVRACVIWFQ